VEFLWNLTGSGLGGKTGLELLRRRRESQDRRSSARQWMKLGERPVVVKTGAVCQRRCYSGLLYRLDGCRQSIGGCYRLAAAVLQCSVILLLMTAPAE
jgi:hypothetical protein